MDFPQPGQAFEGFAVESILGKGGFATVFAARSLSNGELVALKILTPDEPPGYRSDTLARFSREVAILSQLRSPHTVQLLRHGMSVDGFLYLVFEHLGGQDLSDVLKAEGRLDPDRVIAITLQVATALREAHDAGLLHRDLKPQNIRILGDPRTPQVKLLDFGIARSTDDAHPSITKTGELIGTPRYMSPEQLTNQPLGPASDVYSLGMVAFEMLMGPDALSGNSIFDQIDRMRSGHLFSIPEMERATPGLIAVIQRMTGRKLEERFGSAHAVINALDQLRAPRAPAVAAIEPPPPSPRSSHSVPVLTLVLVVLVALVAWFASRLGTPDSRTAVVPPVLPTAATPAQPAEHHETVIPDVATADDAGDITDVGDVGLATPEDRTAGCGKAAWRGPEKPYKVAYYVPKKYDRDVPHPLVVLLQDENRESPEAFLAASGLQPAADSHSFIVISGPPPEEHWRANDMHLLEVRKAVDVAGRELCIDPRRIFVIAHESGARTGMAATCASWVAGVAMTSFLPGERLEEHPTYPEFWCKMRKPLLWLSPTESPGVHLDGTRGCESKDRNMSLPELERRWRERNGCADAPHEVAGWESTCTTWKCATPFHSCRVPGGAVWPGTPPGRGDLLCKEPAMDFPIAERAWEFFEALRLEPVED